MAALWSFRSVVHSTRMGLTAVALLTMPALGNAGDTPPGERLNISMDEARLVRLPERVATIVIGNPLIADASLQPGGLVVLTAKGYGATNFIALDRKGNALLEKVIEVRGAIDTVTVYKGVNRETYSCAPNCQPVIAPGDGQQFYNQILVQTTTRSTQAASSSSSR
ncbi:MAG: pilus assembly protein N-terminal domain-containing protein [Pseudorhodoplanes sp.]|jgi:Flp pilus assembly secretin CpaC